ncbi:MAG: hypothetical protein RIF36_26165 [Imperialibacter sp.]|uniref:hypothetical protein n=1 Tax=Imperialibacter sp. TaxID=2038411 RepID=UPI0032ECBEB7
MMKTQFASSFLFATLLLFGSCNDDPDPVKENEEELITTVRLTFTEGTNSFVAEWKDADGDGANLPTVDDISLEAGKTYAVSVELLNESTTPADNISAEVSEEGTEHQFFFITGDGLALTTTYDDQDADGYPIGLQNTFVAGVAGSGTLTVILRHEPNKTAAGVRDGDATNAAGETDVETAPPFNVTIQ